MESKTTDWFPGNYKPVRVGVYECLYDGHIDLYWWDGNKWVFRRSHNLACLHQSKIWRGLKEPAK